MKRGIEAEYNNQLLLAFNLPTTQQRSVAPAPAKTRHIVETVDLFEPLSERELQVLRLLDSPLTSEEIGQELFVSVNTIRTHIRNIYAKLGVNRRGDAVWRAKELKLM